MLHVHWKLYFKQTNNQTKELKFNWWISSFIYSIICDAETCMLSYSIVPLFWLLYYSTPRASKNHMVYCYCVFFWNLVLYPESLPVYFILTTTTVFIVTSIAFNETASWLDIFFIYFFVPRRSRDVVVGIARCSFLLVRCLWKRRCLTRCTRLMCMHINR